MKNIKTFGAIYIGTYEVQLKIFEIRSDSNGLREIDCLRTRTELARDIFYHKKVSFETLQNLILALNDMKNTMKTYKVDDYGIHAGYALKSAENVYFVLDQIRLHCGLHVTILSNSEQRFLSYQATAQAPAFEDLVSDSAIMADIGGSSLQLTLFEKGKIVTTQHIMLGAFRVRENLKRLGQKSDGREQLYDMIRKEIGTFTNMFLREKKPKYLIMLNDQLLTVLRQMYSYKEKHFLTKDEMLHYLKKMGKDVSYTISGQGQLIDDPDEMFLPFFLLSDTLLHQMDFDKIYLPGASVPEGMALEYAYAHRYLKTSHDFEQDVLSAAWCIAQRYSSYHPHLKAMDKMSTMIFDATKKQHGLKKREKLILRTAAILHDCGKYISLSESPQCSYTIIMSSEILGLTHKEREMVAMIAAYNHRDEITFDLVNDHFTEAEYLVFLKLLAILRVANAMDRSHRQKFKNMSMNVSKNQLIISIESEDSITLEKGLFEEKADFFQSVMAVRPVIRERRV
ncbi:MAG: HD domain-containing protein [Lachnospiraceae bacterium]|nr:HD domain-containing protein [Lachnospiraceae bacterium]MBQ1608117.1 HD domain-containing protein [Lachnospiraceae bacterium]MBR0429884.1 HD domain-containing protein [Lachnospiraceae bacterium]